MKKKTIFAPQQSLFDDHPETTKEPAPTEDDRDGIFDLLDAQKSPIIVFSEEWGERLPERYKDLVPMQRLAANLRKEPLATEAECILYLYSCSLVQPINDHRWGHIYAYLVRKTSAEWLKKDVDMIRGGPDILTSEEESMQRDLRRRIYDTRRKALKERIKHSHNEEPVEKLPIQTTKRSKNQKTTPLEITEQRLLF